MPTRAQLRGIIGARYARYVDDRNKTMVHCVVCDEPVDTWDLHEALVARSAVPPDKQDLIFCIENCVPICRECHKNGHSRDTALHIIEALARKFGAKRIGKWYVSLWEEHGLSVPKGMLIPVKSIKAHDAVSRLLPIGAAIIGLDLPEKGWMRNPGTPVAQDYRALCALRWRGERGRHHMPDEWNGIAREIMVLAIETGYWIEYLKGAVL